MAHVFYMDINNYMQVQGTRGRKESSRMKPTVKQEEISMTKHKQK
jgi:hypothetical protein